MLPQWVQDLLQTYHQRKIVRIVIEGELNDECSNLRCIFNVGVHSIIQSINHSFIQSITFSLHFYQIYIYSPQSNSYFTFSISNLKYLTILFNQFPALSPMDLQLVNYQDVVQIPLQPLMDNLSSATYDVFEQDRTKYILVGIE